MTEVFRQGSKAQLSGVYKVIHHRKHVAPHYVTMLFGDIFPPCLKCSSGVRFELAISAVHANAHHIFSVPRESVRSDRFMPSHRGTPPIEAPLKW
jgi:hypothetical protein